LEEELPPKKLLKGREETFRRATEEDRLPGWTDAIDVMCTDVNNTVVTTHSVL